MCPEGMIALPKHNAPQRLSFQTGIICSFFGATHPLCKWVDQIIPQVPWAEVAGDIGKEIAKRIRLGIKGKGIAELTRLSKNLDFINFVRDTIDSVNQFINDVDATIQGGEVSTLEFCLAGKPPVPEDINYADVFLAFSGLYPDSLIEKMSKVFAYKAFFEHCRCVNITDNPPPSDFTMTPPTYALPFAEDTDDPCERQINDFYREVNRTNEYGAYSLTNAGIASDFADMCYQEVSLDPDNQVEYLGSELKYIQDVGTQYIPRGFKYRYFHQCCYVCYFEAQMYRRFCAAWGVWRWKYTFENRVRTEITMFMGDDTSEPNCTPYIQGRDEYYNQLANFYSPCRTRDEEGNIIYDTSRAAEATAIFLTPVFYVKECRTPPQEKSDDELRDIKPIDPTRNPCDDPENEDYKDLCKDCPPCPECPPGAKITEFSIQTSICDGEPQIWFGSAYDGEES